MSCEKCCSLHENTQRQAEQKKKLIHRLNRLEGQIRGIRKMVEEDVYCTDILVQSAAASAAINRELLEAHIRSCVVRDIQNDQLEIIDELMNTLHKLMK